MRLRQLMRLVKILKGDDNMWVEIAADIQDIKVGDTIIDNDGKRKLVSQGNIKYNDFMGLTLFGDCYKLGTQKARKLIFKEAV